METLTYCRDWKAMLEAEARAKRLYGQWLAEQASRFGMPVLEVHPRATLLDRVFGYTLK